MTAVRIIGLFGGMFTFSLAILPLSIQAQSTFQNLDFEQANPVPIVGSPYYPSAVTASSALPGWTVYLGNTESGQVLYNNEFLGTATVDLISSQFLDGGVIDGQDSVILQSGANSPEGGPLVTASIAQSGTIPANAETLQFKADDPGSLLSVSFAGNNLSSVAIGSGESPSGIPYEIYGVNIAPYDGQSGQLEFTANLGGNVELDDITFSSEAIPEPSTVALAVMAGIICALQRWRRRDKFIFS